MTIYFDIDSTLFTTNLFKKTKIDPQLEELLGVSLETLQESEKAYFTGLEKGTDFDFHNYCAFIAEKFNDVGGSASKEQLEKLFEDQALYEGMVYPDVFPTLQLLQDRGDSIGIFSEGHTDFQTNKITFTGVMTFADPTKVHIARRKLEPEVLSKLEAGAIVIDDKIEYLENLPETLTPVWINRTSEEKHSTIATIKSLEEITQFLLNKKD